MIRSGHGGAAATYDGVVLVYLATSRWTGNWRSRLAEITQSDSGGGTKYRQVVQDPAWTIEFARDDEFFMEALGLTSGTEIAELSLKHGAADQYDVVFDTTVAEVQKVCDNKGDVCQVVVSGQGGVVTEDLTGWSG